MTRSYPNFTVPEHVENESAYIAAAQARYDANRIKGNRKRWMEKYEDAQTLHDWLFGYGEFEDTWQLDPNCTMGEDGYPDHRFELNGEDYRCSCKRVKHRLDFYRHGEFLDKMRDSIDEWGGLTDGQTVAVRKCYQRAQDNSRERAERRLAKIEEDRSTSKHVGILSTRREFTLICEKQFQFDGTYGTTYINICRDDEGNVVVYKGSNAFTENVTVTVVATVKAHEVRDGVAQTIIARPKVK